jgi:hypothetical protein
VTCAEKIAILQSKETIMPSTSDKQRRFMAAAAHDPKFAKRNHIPVSVAMEFNQAYKGKKLAKALMKHG